MFGTKSALRKVLNKRKNEIKNGSSTNKVNVGDSGSSSGGSSNRKQGTADDVAAKNVCGLGHRHQSSSSSVTTDGVNVTTTSSITTTTTTTTTTAGGPCYFCSNMETDCKCATKMDVVAPLPLHLTRFTLLHHSHHHSSLNKDYRRSISIAGWPSQLAKTFTHFRKSRRNSADHSAIPCKHLVICLQTASFKCHLKTDDEYFFKFTSSFLISKNSINYSQ